jgi:phosphoglycolate phosphatase
MAIRGILFDKDGTLLDFSATWGPIYRVAAQKAARGDARLAERLLLVGGHDPQLNRLAGNSVLAAGTSQEIAAVWRDHVPEWDLTELTRMLDRLFMDEGQLSAVPVPGLAATLARLKARGLTLGIATSDSRAGIEATLTPFDVLGHFSFLAGYDSGHGVKPGPGMVHAFCRSSGLRPVEVAVVGDNLHDLHMGRAAGAGLVIGVLTGTGERDILAEQADHVLESIAGIEALLAG